MPLLCTAVVVRLCFLAVVDSAKRRLYTLLDDAVECLRVVIGLDVVAFLCVDSLLLLLLLLFVVAVSAVKDVSWKLLLVVVFVRGVFFGVEAFNALCKL